MVKLGKPGTRRGVAVAVAALLGLPAGSAVAAPKAKQALEIAFEVRARDTRIGQGKLLVGPRAGPGAKALRLLQLTGQTESILGVLYQGELLAHSWVDPQWLPQAARWTSQWAGRKGHVQALFGGGRLRALIERQGRGSRQQDLQFVGFALDPVALVPWLMQQRPQEGQAWTALFFTGADLCKLDIRAQQFETLRQAVAGAEPKATRALRFEATLSQCRIQRSVTAWMAAADQQPLRVVMHDKLLGDVIMDQTGTAQVDLPVLPPPPKEPLARQFVAEAPKP